MNAIIISIGDELVLGQTVDTNSAWLSAKLAAIGCAVTAHVTVADDQAAIEQAIVQSALRCNILLITGGLGPTRDDLTRDALAAALHQPLELNQAALGRIEAFFRLRKRPMSESNRVQAMIPRHARSIENSAGTAPGIDADLNIENKTCRVFAVPGVPLEMQRMFEGYILPILTPMAGGAVIRSRILHTFGIGESVIGERIQSLMDRTHNPSVGTTVSRGGVSLRINSRFETSDRAQAELESTAAQCREILGDLIYGQDDQTLAFAVAQLLTASPSEPRTIATAESCTAGLLGKLLTDLPGSSRYYRQGWITYTNESKIQLGVPADLINRHGAVSEPVALAMAQSALKLSNADHSLAITGIAGPDGGTLEKPVGTVCIAHAQSRIATAKTFSLPGDRDLIRHRAALMALAILRFHLLGKPAPF